jgi:hypothetical protein
MQKPTSILNNQRGSIIIIAIAILTLLTIIGVSATNMSNTEVRISTNSLEHNVAFYAADSGIEAGRAILNQLKIADAASWDNLLQGNPQTWNEVTVANLDGALDAEGGRSVGSATFTLAVADNDDLDGDLLVDTDNVILLTSTGTHRGARAQVQATVQFAGADHAYTQEHYDPNNTGAALRESAEIDNIQRW